MQTRVARRRKKERFLEKIFCMSPRSGRSVAWASPRAWGSRELRGASPRQRATACRPGRVREIALGKQEPRTQARASGRKSVAYRLRRGSRRRLVPISWDAALSPAGAALRRSLFLTQGGLALGYTLSPWVTLARPDA